MFDLLLRDSETSMKLHLEQEEDYSRLGNSRIAGYPDLPPSIAWPCTEDDEHYTFLAQINLGEMPFSPVEGMPNEGMLYFFLGLDEPAYDIEHQVYYYNGDMSLLKKTLPPEGKVEVVEERRGFVPYRVQLLPQLNVISDSEAYETLLDEYSDSLAYATLCDGSDAIWGQHQSFAGDTPMDAYLCRNGMKDLLFNTYKTVERVREEAKQAMERGSETYSEHLISDVLPQLEQFLARKEEHEQASKKTGMCFSPFLHWMKWACAGGMPDIWSFIWIKKI